MAEPGLEGFVPFHNLPPSQPYSVPLNKNFQKPDGVYVSPPQEALGDISCNDSLVETIKERFEKLSTE